MKPSPVRIWIASDHHTAFLCGGWAYVREADGMLTGAAGGERRTTSARTELAGLAAALEGLAPGAAVTVHTPSARLAAAHALIAGTAAEGDAPAGDLDLWARILTAAKGRQLRLVRTAPAPGTPMAFAAAWAELARDKAKMQGDFTSAIPKPNLAKVMGV